MGWHIAQAMKESTIHLLLALATALAIAMGIPIKPARGSVGVAVPVLAPR